MLTNTNAFEGIMLTVVALLMVGSFLLLIPNPF